MKNEQWEAIHAVYEKMEKLCGKLRSPRNPLYTGLLSPEIIPARQETNDGIIRDASDLVRVRADIRTQLDFLRAKLSEQLSERDCYQVLFPIVGHFDELVQTNYLLELQTSWPLLQRELYQIDDAGEVFFETLDDLLLRPQTLPFIYEVYYFCLSYGFRGKYADKPVKITEYLKKLQTKISVESLESLEILNIHPRETALLSHIGSPVWYYLASAVVIGACFYLLYTF